MAREVGGAQRRHQAESATGATGESTNQLPQEPVMKIALAFAASILSFSSLAAHATTPADVTAVEVQYSDLDLDRKAGVVTLYARIKGAADRVCDVQSGRTIRAQVTHAECVNNAVATAVGRVNSPMLSNYVTQLTGKSVNGTPDRVATR